MLAKFLETLNPKERDRFNDCYNITNCRFSLEALQTMWSNCKSNPSKNTFDNCSFVLFSNNNAKIKNSTFKNCTFFGSSLIIEDCDFEDVKVEYCSVFISKHVKLTECTFKNGAKEVQVTNPIIFNFENGSIVNNKPGYIDFFGFTNSYQYFMDRLGAYPYSE